MEKLALTSKILYDKDYLDNKKRLLEHYNFTKVLYKSESEYYLLERAFLDNIHQFDFKSKNEVEIKNFIINELDKISKNKSKEWSIITSNLICISIKYIKNCFGLFITQLNQMCQDIITELLFDSQYMNQIIQYKCHVCHQLTNKLIHPEFCIEPRCELCEENKPVDMIDELKSYISINQSDEGIKKDLDSLNLNYSNLIALKN